MTSHLTFLLLGLGVGSVIAALAIGIVVTHRASGVVNFAHAATGTFIALAYYELRATGDLVLPVLGLPDRILLVDRPTTATALILVAVYAALIGVALYWIVFRPLGGAPPLRTGTGQLFGTHQRAIAARRRSRDPPHRR